MEVVQQCLRHPEETYNLLKYKMGCYKALMPKMDQDSLSDSLRVCYKYLNQITLIISTVIQTLDGDLRHTMCIYYLVLRALDTIEDDTTINLKIRIRMLQNFHSYLYQPDWRFMGSKDKDKQVLEDFPTISLEFRKLPKAQQDVIADICQKMGAGMAEFLEKKVDTIEDWEKYSHYVAGLVGIGASQLLSASDFEDPIIGRNKELLNSFGLFLQKTNTIKDYLKDLHEGREYWPREVWSKYVKKNSDLAKPENIDKAVQCMNELITNTLHHVPDTLTSLPCLKETMFFLAALPLVVTMALLAACYNNQQVFKGMVKIRKGQAVTLAINATNMSNVKAIMSQYVEEIAQKIPSTDPSSSNTKRIVTKIQSICLPSSAPVSQISYSPVYFFCIIILAALIWQFQNML